MELTASSSTSSPSGPTSSKLTTPVDLRLGFFFRVTAWCVVPPPSAAAAAAATAEEDDDSDDLSAPPLVLKPLPPPDEGEWSTFK